MDMDAPIFCDRRRFPSSDHGAHLFPATAVSATPFGGRVSAGRAVGRGTASITRGKPRAATRRPACSGRRPCDTSAQGRHPRPLRRSLRRGTAAGLRQLHSDAAARRGRREEPLAEVCRQRSTRGFRGRCRTGSPQRGSRREGRSANAGESIRRGAARRRRCPSNAGGGPRAMRFGHARAGPIPALAASRLGAASASRPSLPIPAGERLRAKVVRLVRPRMILVVRMFRERRHDAPSELEVVWYRRRFPSNGFQNDLRLDSGKIPRESAIRNPILDQAIGHGSLPREAQKVVAFN